MDFNRLMKSGFIFFSLVAASPVWAAPQQSSQTRAPRIKSRPTPVSHLDLALSVQNGYASLSSATTSASGGMAAFLVTTSYTLPEIVFDLGAGYMSSSLTGDAAGVTSGLQEFEITTSSFVANFSPQYRWTENLQIGPLVQILMGEDVGFKPGIGFTGQTSAWFGGAQALYGFRIGQFQIKAGLNYLKSLNLEEKNLQSIQAALQIGLPIL